GPWPSPGTGPFPAIVHESTAKAATFAPPERNQHVRQPDDVPAFRAAVLVPVLLGVQRQLPQERAGVPHPVCAWRRQSRSADHAYRRRIHWTVLFSLRTWRTNGRSIPQGDRSVTSDASHT